MFKTEFLCVAGLSLYIDQAGFELPSGYLAWIEGMSHHCLAHVQLFT